MADTLTAPVDHWVAVDPAYPAGPSVSPEVAFWGGSGWAPDMPQPGPTEAAELDARFAELAARWKAERSSLLSARQMAEHPAYQAIIELGEPVVPLILAEMKREPDHWFIALHRITGASPVPEAARGRVREMAAAWQQWWRGQNP